MRSFGHIEDDENSRIEPGKGFNVIIDGDLFQWSDLYFIIAHVLNLQERALPIADGSENGSDAAGFVANFHNDELPFKNGQRRLVAHERLNMKDFDIRFGFQRQEKDFGERGQGN